jgi:caa(3)-type oxidase subunit IV
MTDAQHSDRPYVMIWGALMGALVISLLLGLVAGSRAAVAMIFLVAIAKATVVISRFMHLRDEPGWIRYVFFGAISVLVILWVGLLWDIARAFS